MSKKLNDYDLEKLKKEEQERLDLIKSEINPMLHNDSFHTSIKNMSRRDLLGQGLIAGSGLLMMPSFLSSLSSSAHAQSSICLSASLNTKIPFMSIDLSGGAAISGGNVMVGGPGGQMDMLSDAGYKKMGFAPNTQKQVNSELGILFHADSAFLRGIKSKASAAAIAKTNGAVACMTLANDTQNNTQSPLAGIILAGARGALFPSIGTRDSDSGARSKVSSSIFEARLRPVRIADEKGLRSAIDTGRLTAVLGRTSSVSIMKRIRDLSEARRIKLTDEAVKKELLGCHYKGATSIVENFSDPTALDIRADKVLVGTTGIFSEAELKNGKYNRAATHAKAVINGYSGASVMEFGGYDYHNSKRSTGEIRDFEAGVTMGASIEYAHQKGKQLVLYVFSDGSVRSEGVLDGSDAGRGKGTWKGDSGGNSAALILVYSPGGRAPLTEVGHQLGHYLPTGTNNSKANIVSKSANNLAYWVVLNYMALNGDIGNFATTFPDNPFGSSAEELSPYIHFAAI